MCISNAASIYYYCTSNAAQIYIICGILTKVDINNIQMTKVVAYIIHMYVCMYTHLCVYICVCVCITLYKYIKRWRKKSCLSTCFRSTNQKTLNKSHDLRSHLVRLPHSLFVLTLQMGIIQVILSSIDRDITLEYYFF